MKTPGKYLAIWGVVLQIGFIVGLASIVVSWLIAYAMMTRGAEPDVIARAAGIASVITWVGLALSVVGMILILVALYKYKYRAPWFQSALWILAILWLLGIPIGTILGIVTIIYLITHKKEFAEPSEISHVDSAGGYPPVT